ncbi:hypothetical protein ACA910_017976 [Epithemia clementina (nom. ined.)]
MPFVFGTPSSVSLTNTRFDGPPTLSASLATPTTAAHFRRSNVMVDDQQATVPAALGQSQAPGAPNLFGGFGGVQPDTSQYHFGTVGLAAAANSNVFGQQHFSPTTSHQSLLGQQQVPAPSGVGPRFGDSASCHQGSGPSNPLPGPFANPFTAQQEQRGTSTIAYQVTRAIDGAKIINLHSITGMPPYKNVSFEELRFQDYSMGSHRELEPNCGTKNIPYQPTRTTRDGKHPLLHVITAMPAFTNKSFEELRFEDYSTGNKGQVPAPDSTTTTTATDDNRTCVICLEEKADHVLIPCGHVCLCKSCQASTRTCPLCRARCRAYQIFL